MDLAKEVLKILIEELKSTDIDSKSDSEIVNKIKKELTEHNWQLVLRKLLKQRKRNTVWIYSFKVLKNCQELNLEWITIFVLSHSQHRTRDAHTMLTY